MKGANPYTKLTESPKTVKEAIDWIIRLVRKDSSQTGLDCTNFCTSLTAVLGDGAKLTGNQVKELGEALSKFIGWNSKGMISSQPSGNDNGIAKQGYTSAYMPEDMFSNNANWRTICKDAKKANASNDEKCCSDSSGENGCESCDTTKENSEYKDCPMKGCCNKCPKQICARIFCLIVPVLHSVFYFLKSKIENDWHKQQITDGEIGEFFKACGFEITKLDGGNDGEQIKDKVKKVFEELTLIKKAMDEALETANGNFLKDAKPAVSPPDTSPQSICHTLLWLQFLPYTPNYKNVIQEVKNHIPNTINVNKHTFDALLKELISRIPMLFLFIEGKGGVANPYKGNSIFQKIATLSRCQKIYEEKYYSAENAVKILLSVMPALHWSVHGLSRPCVDEKCSKNVKECQRSKLLLPYLGWKTDGSTEPLIEGNMPCPIFKKYIQTDLTGSSTGTLSKIKEATEKAWNDDNAGYQANNSGQNLPKNIYEMLIWLQCLPASGKFKELKQKIKILNDIDFTSVMGEYTKIVFRLPKTFYTLNGGFSGILNDLFKCHGISDKSSVYNYGNDGDQCLNMFSAIVAILYSVVKYLQQRCTQGGKVFTGEDSWTDKQIKTEGVGEYLTFMGFDSNTAIDINNGSQLYDSVLKPVFGELTSGGKDQSLEILYDCAVKHLKQGLVDGKQVPKTIRQMMLWLIGLPLCGKYNGAQGLAKHIQNEAGKISGLSDIITNDNSGLEQQLSHSIVGMMTLFYRIEGSITSVVSFLKEGFKDNGAGIGEQFIYNKEAAQLLNDFSSYVTSVHVQLRFLLTMCNTDQEDGGWKNCIYTSNGQGSGGITDLMCQCSSPSVRGAGNTCPLFLKEFLQNEGNVQPSNGNQFKLKNGDKTERLHMGFHQLAQSASIATVQQRNLTGLDIHTYLKYLLNDAQSASSKPLSILTQYCVGIGQVHPQSLGDLFDLFSNLATKWKSLELHGSNRQNFNDVLSRELNNYMIGVKGDENACNKLSEKIKALMPDSSSHNSHKNDTSLYSLMCSNVASDNTCSPYMKSLSQGLYSYYAPSITEAGNTTMFGALQWLYDMLRRLLDGMQKLKHDLDNCDCCKTPPSSQPCTKLLQCQYAHPFLYKAGLVFGDPKKLTTKNCQHIKTQLEAVLSCTKASQPALFSALECVIQVTYKILFVKAKGNVESRIPIWNDQVKSKDETKQQFFIYIENAMYQSYHKLICIFACGVFNDKHECDKLCEKLEIPGPMPAALLPHTPTNVSSENVATITAIITPYNPPYIDHYQYKTYKKNAFAAHKGGNLEDYKFTDAIDFHVDKAQCITPTPVALRSVIDWLLRVTMDKGSNTKLNKQLADAIESVLNNSIASAGAVEINVTALVDGLRKFMGYTDKSVDVTKKVEGERSSVTINVEEHLKKIKNFLGNKQAFATEMGMALLKGTYDENGKPVSGDRNKTFQEVIKNFQGKLDAEHKACKSGLQCDTSNPATAITTSGTVNANGLKQLHGFLQMLREFAAKWDQIGENHGDSILLNQKTTAINAIQYHGSPSCNVDYFKNLQQALKNLGDCSEQVQALEKPKDGYTNSEQYREKITALITELKKFGEHIKGCDFNAAQDPQANGKADPQYAVKGAEELIKLTKSNVEETITSKIKGDVEGKYTQPNAQCSVHSGNPHQLSQQYMCVATIIKNVTDAINEQVEKYKSHLDDLKQLCQWLYRMGQLYQAGLHDFVKCLIENLQHIIQVIKWIEGIEKMITTLNTINNKSEIINSHIFSQDITNCCQNHVTNGIYNSSNRFENRHNFFTALNCRINNLLKSYVLQNSNALPNDNSEQRCTLLRDLRLLALDRYTLQVWQDECNDSNCKIKNWVTFDNGIVRHSSLGEIKTKLQELTRIAYNTNSPATHSPTNRIHDFHAICVIQKFSFQEPITRLEGSLKELEGIQKQLSDVKGKCTNGQTNLSSDTTVIQPFCTAVSQFLAEEYGIYSLAKFLHTILGPNIFSAAIAALEEVKDKEKYKNAVNGKLDKIKGILEVLVDGLTGNENKKDVNYKLDEIIKKLKSFISTLRKEYIFSYPVVTASTAQSNLVAPSASQALATDHSATGILSKLKTVTPVCLSDPDAHKNNAICDKCYEVFAYIFLGQIPKLYHSFRFMLWNLHSEWMVNPQGADNQLTKRINDSITSYLVSMGFNNGNIHNAVGNGLHDRFKKVLEEAFEEFKKASSPPDTTTPSHEPNCLKEIHGKLEELLKGLIKEQHNEAVQSMLKSGKDLRRRPRTIREMLHWLSGVPFSVMYEEMQTFSTGLCDLTKALTYTKDTQVASRTKHTIPSDWILYRLGVSCAECLDVLQAVEDPLGKEPTRRLREYIKAYDFYYPASSSQLFYMFVDVMYYVYVHMKFVCNMTGRERNDGGWKDCEFINTKVLILQNYNKDKVQCQCNLNFVEYTCAGPLRRLLSSVSNVFTGRSLGFTLTKEKLYSGQLMGAVIHNVIKHIFGKDDNYSQLCRLMLAVSTCPPISIGDMISFLYWYRRALFVDGSQVGTEKNAETYKYALHHEIELFPGTFDPEKLTNALDDCFKGHTEGQLQGQSHEEVNKENMLSIMDCLGQADESIQLQSTEITCAPYLGPLSFEVYDTYVPQFSRAYLSWILHFGPRIYTALEEIKGKLKEDCKNCMTNKGSTVTCNDVLPELYSKGLDFWDPKILNGWKYNKQDGRYKPNGGTKMTCSTLITQLSEVLRICSPGESSSPGAPLHRLIEAIEAFLWSIRLPFSVTQLSLWSVAVLFISYVFIVPLDHFKIKSHLFNRLKYTMHPSLLVSDGQRRLSEVAYFAL